MKQVAMRSNQGKSIVPFAQQSQRSILASVPSNCCLDPESTFHHFADYNWDPSRGSPDFVSEKEGYELPNNPPAMASVHSYVRNVALWLAGRL